MSETGDRKSLRPRASFLPLRGDEPEPEPGFTRSDPPSGSLASEEFLYHLYRGTELLQDNRVEQAKDELERALLLQPRDVEGQGLLGIVYFRLGLYPRAIDIYERLSHVAPNEIAPKVNLALCYLKTGQLALARQSLEEVLSLEPEHKRAWAYLGLIFQRQSEYGKARSSFERAEQPAMAERMRQLEEHENDAGGALLRDDHPHELRRAAEGAFEELEYGKDPFAVAESTEITKATSGSGRWRAIELGGESLPQLAKAPRPMPPVMSDGDLMPELTATKPDDRSSFSLGHFVQTRSLSSVVSRGASLLDDSTLRVAMVMPFAIRAGSVRAATLTVGPWTELRLARRSGPRDSDEPLGGANDPIVSVDIAGDLIAHARDQILTLVQLDNESVAIREENIFGFDAQLRYDCGRFEVAGGDSLALVEFSGVGVLVLRWSVAPRTLAVGGQCTLVQAREIAGWTGRVVPQAIDPAESPGKLRGFVGFTGEGALILL